MPWNVHSLTFAVVVNGEAAHTGSNCDRSHQGGNSSQHVHNACTSEVMEAHVCQPSI